MMLRFLLLLCWTTASLLAEKQCADGYKAMDDGRCFRVLYLNKLDVVGTLLSTGIEECSKEGASLPIIRSDQENAMFDDIGFSLKSDPRLILGLVCNTTSRRMEWADGSEISYSYKNFDLSFDCVSNSRSIVSLPKLDIWKLYSPNDRGTWIVLCVADPTEGPPKTTARPATTTKVVTIKVTTATAKPSDAQCGDYESIANPKDECKPCFQIFTDPVNWKEAQQKCADDFGSLATINSDQENKFFWRSAVAKNVLDDMHIGAYQSAADPKVWQWIDGSGSTADYSNFFGAFPIPGGGSCTAMLTESSTAQWINEDCEHQTLPFVCRRISFSNLPTECPHDSPKPETDIFPPGFPTPDIPCEYMLVVDTTSLVQLEILALEADPNKDFLEIFEGAVGKNMLASLTGTNPPSTITTKSSNVMRVNWKPNANDRPSEYRGFRIRYRAVPIN